MGAVSWVREAEGKRKGQAAQKRREEEPHEGTGQSGLVEGTPRGRQPRELSV